MVTDDSAKLFLRLDSSLFCHSQFHDNPFNRLGPFKVEELNMTPLIVVFHGYDLF